MVLLWSAHPQACDASALEALSAFQFLSSAYPQARVFQSSKCALTGAPLELPAVHFLCGHAFNLRSLGENDRECPLCAPQFRAILDIRRSLRTGAAEQVQLAALDPSLDAYPDQSAVVFGCRW